MNKKFNWNKFFNLLLLFISMGMLVYFCVVDNNLLTLLGSLPTLNFFWLFLAAAAVPCSWLIDASILHILTCSAYQEPYSLKNAFKVTMVGQYFSAITPFAAAGQPMQFVALSRQGVSGGVALSILVRKFLIYQTTLAAYSFLVILFKLSFFREHIPAFVALALVGFLCQAGIVIMLLFFSTNRKLTTKIINGIFWLLSKVHIVRNPEKSSEKVQSQLSFYLDSNKSMNHNLRMNLKLYSLTFLQLTALFLVPFLLFKAFHHTGFPVIDMISGQAFVTMIASYTPLPGAAGTTEGGFLLLFHLFFSGEVIKQAMLLWRFITYYSGIIVGSFFAGLEKKKEKMEPAFSGIPAQKEDFRENAELSAAFAGEEVFPESEFFLESDFPPENSEAPKKSPENP